MRSGASRARIPTPTQSSVANPWLPKWATASSRLPRDRAPTTTSTGALKELDRGGLALGSSRRREPKGRKLVFVFLKDVAGMVPGAYRGTRRDRPTRRATGWWSAAAASVEMGAIKRTTAMIMSFKWGSVTRRGRGKLVGMFSGYKQSQAFTQDAFLANKKYAREQKGWDEGDLHRLESAFVRARFPMALALNKNYNPSAARDIGDIGARLTVHRHVDAR